MLKNKPDTLGNWVEWCFAAIVIASFTIPVRFLLFPESYDKLTMWQEILLFIVEVAGLTVFVTRRFSKGMENDNE